MKTRWIILVVVIVVSLVIVGWRLNSSAAIVGVVEPRIGPIQAFIEERAITELPHDHLISMPISGWLQRIELREGDPVKEGQAVAYLEVDDLKDRVLQAEQRIKILESDIAKASDHRLEDNMLVEIEASVKAIDETVRAAEAKLQARRAVADFAMSEARRLRSLGESNAASNRELRKAETDLRQAEAEYQGDVLEVAALKTLAAVSYIGPKFIRDYKDRKSFELESLKRQLAEAKAELEIKRRNLDRAVIVSPIEGVVLNRMKTRRQYLQAGTPLLAVGRLEEMEVIAEVLSERATRISVGDTVEIFGAAIEDGPIAGKVVRVYPAGFRKVSSLGVEQQRVKVAIRMKNRPPRLGTAFRVHVRIIYAQAAEALVVPRTAMFRGDGQSWCVMTVDDGVTARRVVTLGLANDDQVQILKGLSAGDKVIQTPSREIVEGMRVRAAARP